jgi:hypothetical protein
MRLRAYLAVGLALCSPVRQCAHLSRDHLAEYANRMSDYLRVIAGNPAVATIRLRGQS